MRLKKKILEHRKSKEPLIREIGLLKNRIQKLKKVESDYRRIVRQLKQSENRCILAKEKLQELSLVDELTELRNRRGFNILAEQQLKISKRHNMKIVIFYIDIDNFKYINDTLGHKEGNKVLMNFSLILKKTTRESDIVARIGGDEFAVLAIGMNEEDSDGLANRLKENIDSFNAKAVNSYKLAISIGKVYCDSKVSACSIEDLITRADKLMYEQKHAK